MNARLLGILQHSLGADQYGRIERYSDRNHYVAGPDAVAYCRELVALGYMVERRASELTGGDPLFHVTDAGKRAMREESPIPPKLTPGQKRYLEFLDAADAFNCSFKEWLKMRKTDWYKALREGI